jgi:uncharacterized DUF497 family protein
LSFEVAVKAFDDNAAQYEFNSVVDGEYREQVTGRIVGGLLVVQVVYTSIEGGTDGKEIYRIICARKAGRDERRRYEETAH